MEDVIKEIKLQLYERINSPLASTFFVSWCIWNWKFIVILLSEISIYDKLSYINTMLYPGIDNLWAWINLLFGPLLATFFYIYIYPYPAKKVYEYVRNQQKEMKKIRQKIEDEHPMTQAEAKQLREKTLETKYQLEKQFDTEVDRNNKLETEIKFLREKIAKLQAEADQFDSNSNSYSEAKDRFHDAFKLDLKDTKTQETILRILLEIAAANDYVSIDNTASNISFHLGIPKYVIETYIQILLRAGFLLRDENKVQLSSTGKVLHERKDFSQLEDTLDDLNK